MSKTIASRIRAILDEGPATAREVAGEIFDGPPTQHQVKIMSAHLCEMKKGGLVEQLYQIRVHSSHREKDGEVRERPNRRTWVWGLTGTNTEPQSVST